MRLELLDPTVAIDSVHPDGHFTTRGIGKGVVFNHGTHTFVLSRRLSHELTIEDMMLRPALMPTACSTKMGGCVITVRDSY